MKAEYDVVENKVSGIDCWETVLPWVACISPHLRSRHTDYFCSRLSFQGGLCSKQLGKLERVPLPGAKGRHSYFPYERAEFAKLRIQIPLLQPTT